MNNKLEQLQDNISYLVHLKDETLLERKPGQSINELCKDNFNNIDGLLITYKDLQPYLISVSMVNVKEMVFHFTVYCNTEHGVVGRILNYGYIDNNDKQFVSELVLNILENI